MSDPRLFDINMSFAKPVFVCCADRCRTEKLANLCLASSVEEATGFLHRHKHCHTFIQPSIRDRK